MCGAVCGAVCGAAELALRHVLQHEQTLDGAVAYLQAANRTCNLILGVGDGKAPAEGAAHSDFRAFRYSAAVAPAYDDATMEPHAAEGEVDWHPYIEDAVYYGMDWLCPNFSEVLAGHLLAHHGRITPEVRPPSCPRAPAASDPSAAGGLRDRVPHADGQPARGRVRPDGQRHVPRLPRPQRQRGAAAARLRPAVHASPHGPPLRGAAPLPARWALALPATLARALDCCKRVLYGAPVCVLATRM